MKKYLWMYVNKWACYIVVMGDKEIQKDIILWITKPCGHICFLNNINTMPTLQRAQTLSLWS